MNILNNRDRDHMCLVNIVSYLQRSLLPNPATDQQKDRQKDENTRGVDRYLRLCGIDDQLCFHLLLAKSP